MTRRTLPRTLFTVWTLFVLFSVLVGNQVNAACAPCDLVENLLKPCNTSLRILTWPGEMVFQPDEVQAPCACNENFYNQTTACLKCESSDRASYSVHELGGYKLVCESYNQPWKIINMPNAPSPSKSTTTTTSSSTGTALPSDNATAGDNPSSSSSSNLSNGALAGMRRQRERSKADDDYKYNSAHRDSYMEVALPQYNGMIQPILPPISKVS
ncbi:hypothetical protein BG004_001096, partial [Podila humilis]